MNALQTTKEPDKQPLERLWDIVLAHSWIPSHCETSEPLDLLDLRIDYEGFCKVEPLLAVHYMMPGWLIDSQQTQQVTPRKAQLPDLHECIREHTHSHTHTSTHTDTHANAQVTHTHGHTCNAETRT